MNRGRGQRGGRRGDANRPLREAEEDKSQDLGPQNRRAALQLDDDNDIDENWFVNNQWYSSEHFREQSRRFEEWIENVRAGANSYITFRASRRIIIMNMKRRRSKFVSKYPAEIVQMKFKLPDILRMTRDRRLRVLIGLTAYKNIPDISTIEEYKEDEDQVGQKRKFQVTDMSFAVLKNQDKQRNFQLVAYGQNNKKNHESAQFSKQFDNTQKSNMPMFESVRLFAQLNQCKCLPGRAIKPCQGFLLCPLDFQHPIQTLHDLVCQNKYLCVGLALSIALYSACRIESKLLGFNPQSKQTLAKLDVNKVLPRDLFEMTQDQQNEYSDAIDSMMRWSDRKGLHIYEVLVQSGIDKLNAIFQREQISCTVHLVDLFQETVLILRKVEQTQDVRLDSIKREIGRHMVRDRNGDKSVKTKTNFYLVYYMSHVMLMTKEQIVLLYQKFAGDFIKNKLRPFMLMPNLNPHSLFSRVTTISSENLKKTQDSDLIQPPMCNWFDGSKKQAFQVNTQVMKSQDLKGSVAIMQSEQDEVNLAHIEQIRTKHFESYGLAAFDIETCMETDHQKLQCGTGNQIPYMLSLKGRLYDYKNQELVKVEQLFTNLENFGHPFTDVCHQFVQFLIEGNHFSLEQAANKNYIFAHNGCKFDFLFIIQWLAMYQQKTGFRMIGNPDKLKAIVCQGISFYDSFLIISRSLNQMSKSFLGRQKNEIDIGDIKKEVLTSPQFTEPLYDGKSKIQLIGEYCKLDSELLYLCMEKFFKAQYLVPMKVVQGSDTFYVYNQKTFHITASSMALSLFTTCFLKYPVGCVPKFLKIERDTYAGGYTCNLRSLCSFGLSLDINSSYAAQMLASMPLVHKDSQNVQTWNLVINGSVDYQQHINDHDLYHVSYDLVLDEVSSIIVRSKNKMGLIELQKQDDVWMWGIQIKQIMLLLKTQNSQQYLKIHESIQYEPRAIYKEYIQTIYKQRTDNAQDQVLNALYKMLLCGLYGKHGQRDMKSQQMFTSIQDAIDYVNLAKCYMNQTKNEELQKQNMWLYVVRQANDSKLVDDQLQFIESEQPLIYCVEVMESAQHHIGSLVRMASFICAKARVHLVSSYNQVVEQLAQQLNVTSKEMSTWFQLSYCDTDSLYVDSHKLMARLIEQRIPPEQMTNKLNLFVQMTNDDCFIQFTRQQSKTEQGLNELKDLYVQVAQASGFFQLLDSIQITDPGDTTRLIKFVDPKVLGSFKIEKFIVAAAFAAPKQYSTYYFENFESGDVKNDVKMKGVRAEARNKNPQLIFEQVDMALLLFKRLQSMNLSDLQSKIIDQTQIKLAIAQLFIDSQNVIDSTIMTFDNLLQFRGHKTGVTIYKLSKYVSFVLSKRQVVVSSNSQCIESKPHLTDQTFQNQRANLAEITKQLRAHKKTLMQQNQNSVTYEVDAKQCSLTVKRNNLVTQEFKAIVEENTKQPYWFYDQALVINSCVTVLDKIQSTTAQSFIYNRQNLPTNLQLIERYIKFVKNSERLKIIFHKAYMDFQELQNSIDVQVLTEAFQNDILKGFVAQNTPLEVVIDVYGKLMLLNMCLANKIWRVDQLKKEQDDCLFNQFNEIFKQQKAKLCRKKSMTECVVNFNLSVIFKVTMFQYTCRLLQMALDQPQIEMTSQQVKYGEIKQAWDYERNHVTVRQQLEMNHIDIFLSMTPVTNTDNWQDVLDCESSENE